MLWALIALGGAALLWGAWTLAGRFEPAQRQSLALRAALGGIGLLVVRLWVPGAALLAFAGILLAAPGRRSQRSSSRPASLTRDEALTILGLPADAGPQDIEAAFKRLALRNHPDQGGSAELMRRITEARDALLKD